MRSILTLSLLSVAFAVACAPAQGSGGAADHPSASAAISHPAGAATKESWRMFKKPTDEELRSRLTREQYDVTQHEGTEAPFRNAFWNNHEDGLYVDVVSGEPLFSSREKFESGTGWPSFWQPLDPANVVEKTDTKLWMTRTEVRSKHGNSHLGHVFPDGPRPTGLRYCINSAALRFIPVSRLEAEGYGEYLSHFQKAEAKKP